MSDLAAIVAFIEARLAEWETTALACIGINDRARMLSRGTPPPRWFSPEDSSDIRSEDGILRVRHTWKRESDHIVLHDPASVLRQAAAIRRILGWADSPALPDYEKLYVLDAVARFWDQHPDYPGERPAS